MGEHYSTEELWLRQIFLFPREDNALHSLPYIWPSLVAIVAGFEPIPGPGPKGWALVARWRPLQVPTLGYE